MDDILRSHIDIRRDGRLYRSLCLSCGAFVGASASLELLKLAEHQHQCEPGHGGEAVLDTRAVARPPRVLAVRT